MFSPIRAIDKAIFDQQLSQVLAPATNKSVFMILNQRSSPLYCLPTVIVQYITDFAVSATWRGYVQYNRKELILAFVPSDPFDRKKIWITNYSFKRRALRIIFFADMSREIKHLSRCRPLTKIDDERVEEYLHSFSLERCDDTLYGYEYAVFRYVMPKPKMAVPIARSVATIQGLRAITADVFFSEQECYQRSREWNDEFQSNQQKDLRKYCHDLLQLTNDDDKLLIQNLKTRKEKRKYGYYLQILDKNWMLPEHLWRYGNTHKW